MTHHRKLRRISTTGTFALIGLLGAFGGERAAATAEDVLPLAGFVGEDELGTHGSAGFVLMDGAYHFVQAPGAADTSLSAIDEDAAVAYGWSRDLPADDPAATEWSWTLDLTTGTFETIEISDAGWAVVRNGVPGGPLVGKLSDNGGTPNDAADDVTHGFIYDLATRATTRVVRDGYDDIGFTAINADGVVTGFNSFGELGFVYDGGEFVDLVDADAYRLFPFQVNDRGTIVGFWGKDADTWYLNGVSPSFIAHWDGATATVERYELPGFAGTGLTALNNHGMIGGLVYETAESTPTVFLAEDATQLPQLYPLPPRLDPFLTGVTDGGIGYGQVWLSEPEPVATSPDVDTKALTGADALVDAARQLSGYAHSGPLANALHGLFHEIETPAVAARTAVTTGDPDTALASLDDVGTAVGAARDALDTASAPAADVDAANAVLDEIEAAAEVLRAELDT